MTTGPVQADPNPQEPNPERSSATLSAFVRQVQGRLGLDTEPEAEVLVRATLNKLGEEISSGIAQELTASLPPELSAELRAQGQHHDQARKITKEGFIDQVSGSVHSVDAEEVEKQVRQVLLMVREGLSEDQAGRVLDQLPGDLASLMS